jgi:hypothetical protein
LLFTIFLTFPVMGFSLGPASYTSLNLPDSDRGTDPGFSLFINPLGFIQFGPFMGVEIPLKGNVVLNAHTRISSLGLLSYVVRGEDVDKISGYCLGAGPVVLLGEGQNRPYLGMLIEYDKADALYHKGASNERTNREHNIAFFFNGGYRFRFSSGFFVSTGAFLGVARTTWTEDYTDPDREDEEDGGIRPFGMFEVTLGLEF